jgi:hypothetical protein
MSNKGRTFSEEHKAKLRQSHTGKKYPNRKPMSEEHKEKMRESLRKKYSVNSTVRIVKAGKRDRIKKPVFKPHSIELGFTIKNRDMPPQTTEVAQCKLCTRMYLPKLGCLYCEVYDKNKMLSYR